MLTGKALMDDVNKFSPNDNQLAFWWLGQLGYIVKTRQATLVFDPYLNPKSTRLVPPLLKPEELTEVDYILGSHDHSDHIDHSAWPGISAASPNTRFIIPELFYDSLYLNLDIPKDRFIGLDEGKVFRDSKRDITFIGIASAHEFLDPDPVAGLHPSMGFIVECGNFRIYHSGDTCKYEGLETKLKSKGAFDLFFVPINGRSGIKYRSGIIGNMDWREAADLAGAIKPRLTVPGHYEMFANNKEDPMPFVEFMEAKYPECEFWIGGHGTRTVLET